MEVIYVTAIPFDVIFGKNYGTHIDDTRPTRAYIWATNEAENFAPFSNLVLVSNILYEMQKKKWDGKTMCNRQNIFLQMQGVVTTLYQVER